VNYKLEAHTAQMNLDLTTTLIHPKVRYFVVVIVLRNVWHLFTNSLLYSSVHIYQKNA